MLVKALSLTVLATIVLKTTAQVHTEHIVYDTRFDNANGSTHTTACYGLLEHNWPTYGSFPSYPFVGASPHVHYFDDFTCGSCWKLTSTHSGHSVYFTAIDQGPDVVTSLQGLELLTGYMWPNIPAYIQVTAEQVDRSFCGTQT